MSHEGLVASTTAPTGSDPGYHNPPEVNRLGRHILIEPVGRGSFATVWSAYDPELDRRVAIKLLPARKRDTADDLANQLAEAQALAQLAHPSVVAVHDVQVIAREEGAVGLFIVMEFLEGPSLLEWMQQEHPVREIIEVFTAAGRGLAAAHERGIVHRDFKPSNAMFGRDGRLRVLDFGIARTTADARGRGEAGEAKGRYAGTPAYMAPEQHLGEAVDARSDQFAFCVALFEALYGRRPFDGDDRTALGNAKLRGLIEPPRDKPVPAWVRNIVLRGLSTNPNERFASMDELLAALGHNPRRALARVMIGIGLTITIAASGYGLATFTADEVAPAACESGEAKLEGVWDDDVRADVAASFHATEVPFAADAFERVTESLDAHTAQWARLHREVCEAALVRNEHSVEVMAEQMLCLDRRLRRIAGLTGALRRADASTVARAPDSVLRLEPPETCRDRHASERPQLDERQRVELLGIEAEVAHATVLVELGRYDEALATADAAIERAMKIDDLAGASQARLARASALWNLGRYAESIDGAEAALSNAAAAGDREVEAQALLQLIRSYTTMAEYDAADAIAEITASVILDGRLGRELEAHHDFVVAILYGRQHRFDEAIAKLEHGMLLSEQVYGSDHPELAKFHNTLGNTLLTSGRDRVGALAHYDEALRLWIENFGEQYPNVSLVRNNVASLRIQWGEYDEARRLLEQVIVAFETVLGEAHPQLVPAHVNLGQIANFQGRSRDALSHLERARALSVAAFGEDSLRTAEVDRAFAWHLLSMGRIDEAEALYERMLRLQTSELPAEHADKGRSLEALAGCRLARADIVGWRARAEQAATIFAALPEEDMDFHRGLALAAEFALHDEHPERAVELIKQALDHARSTNVPEYEVALYTANLMKMLIANGESSEAVARGREVLASGDVPAGDRRSFGLHLQLARALAREGDRKAAIASYERALELVAGPDGNPLEFESIRSELDRFARR
jgi:tetratricopeptide (TPR) repeat protein